LTPNLPFGDKVPYVQLAAKRNGLLNDGDEILVVPLPPPLDKVFNQNLNFEIRFGGVDGLPELSATKTLAHLVHYVEKIVTIAARRLY
jgi:hypothetical protein